MFLKLFVFFGLLLSTEATISNNNATEFIMNINRKQSLWKADLNFEKQQSKNYLKHLKGLRPHENDILPIFSRDLGNLEIPESFDWRDRYPNCTSLREIRDQGNCGSCWAFATVEVISDRICISSKGTRNVHISANDLLSCCTDRSHGCHGGLIHSAFQYWETTGIVTGGSYDSKKGCRDYEIPPCEHVGYGARPKCFGKYKKTPECKRFCRVNYSLFYEEDLHFGKSAYGIHNDAKQIQAEIMLNGPVAAEIKIAHDFFHYKSGVYKHVQGNFLYNHGIKILGWGVDNGTPYWLCANSWNTDWGENGFFRFLRGVNHCGIENVVTAGIPV